MLIKTRDDDATYIQSLERLAAGEGKQAQDAKRELRNRKAGARAEEEAAYLLDFNYGQSPNWAVIHDLRLEVDGLVAQIDHLLINRFLDVYVLETKHFHAGVKINDDGEFLRWNDFKRTYEGMPSPLMQNTRHVQVLVHAFKCVELPRRLGFRVEPRITPLVLISSKARIDRSRRYDSSALLKVDQFVERMAKYADESSPLELARVVSSDTVRSIAEQLSHLHRPLVRSVVPEKTCPDAFLPAEPAAQVTTQDRAEPSPPLPTQGLCRSCGTSNGSIQYGRYGYFFVCNCGISTNLKLKCAAGHAAKVRKAGLEFFRECAECSSSEVLHTNPPS